MNFAGAAATTRPTTPRAPELCWQLVAFIGCWVLLERWLGVLRSVVLYCTRITVQYHHAYVPVQSSFSQSHRSVRLARVLVGSKCSFSLPKANVRTSASEAGEQTSTLKLRTVSKQSIARTHRSRWRKRMYDLTMASMDISR